MLIYNIYYKPIDNTDMIDMDLWVDDMIIMDTNDNIRNTIRKKIFFKELYTISKVKEIHGILRYIKITKTGVRTNTNIY